MDLLLNLLETLGAAALRIWPGVVVAALGGYLGWQWLSFFGFMAGAAIGALGGTWVGAKLELVRVPAMSGNSAGDHLLLATGAFAVVTAGYMLLQFVFILAAIAVVIAIGALWMAS